VAASILLLLVFELHVYVTYLSPSRVAHYCRTVLRVAFLGVENTFLHREDSGSPQFFREREVELKIFDVFDIHHILVLDFSVGEFVGSQLVLLIHIDDSLLRGTIDPIKIALEALLQLLVLILIGRCYSLLNYKVEVVYEKLDFLADIKILALLAALLHDLKHFA
jgi:hypothetical protein